ncbi:MAG: DUF996 domain-containing protein [Thaumarchaeota archaeon]|nr:MAG: DUF996 domain-containing protein [Nitrososphaerota archaeon]
MPSLSQAKTLGGVGSILAVLGIVPIVGSVLQVVGLIMTLVAVKYISDVLADKRIFNNMIISVILSIAVVAVFAVFVVGAIARFIGLASLFGTSQSVPPGTVPPADIVSLITRCKTQRGTVQHRRLAVPYRSSSYDYIGWVRAHLCCADFGDCRVLLAPRSATDASFRDGARSNDHDRLDQDASSSAVGLFPRSTGREDDSPARDKAVAGCGGAVLSRPLHEDGENRLDSRR